MSPFLRVPAGEYQIGVLANDVDACVEEWKNRLINPCYSETAFREWILKEFPRYTARVEEFEMAQMLVSNAEAKLYLAQANAPTPESIASGTPDDHPVWGVSREWAGDYCEWLSEKDSTYNYRLPTETDWEAAARGADGRLYPYGSEFNANAANTIESGIGNTTPVHNYQEFPGPFGHLDLAGNVEEWVSSNYYVYPGGTAVVDDLYERLGSAYPILRGGSFRCGGDLSRTTRRHGPFPDEKFKYTGFRIVRELKQTNGGSSGKRKRKVINSTRPAGMGAFNFGSAK